MNGKSTLFETISEFTGNSGIILQKHSPALSVSNAEGSIRIMQTRNSKPIVVVNKETCSGCESPCGNIYEEPPSDILPVCAEKRLEVARIFRSTIKE